MLKKSFLIFFENSTPKNKKVIFCGFGFKTLKSGSGNFRQNISFYNS